MSLRGKQLLKEVLLLPPAERAEIAEQILSSLDPPSQSEIDRMWGEEAEERLDAFDRGEIQAIPAREVFSKLCNKPE